MGDDLGAANVNRSYSLAATSIAIFTFLLFFLGCTPLFLGPSLVLFSIGLFLVGSVWFTLWLVYALFVMRFFPRVQAARK